MSSTCRAAGCARPTTRYGAFCNAHKSRLRRHGAPDQRAITAAALAPYIGRVKARRAKNENNLLWTNLDRRWLSLVEHTEGIQASFLGGRAGYFPRYQAACELLKLTDLSPEPIVETILAMYLLLDAEPRRFKSDEAFRAQLVRRVRGLAKVNMGTWFDHRAGRVKRAYRDLPPRATVVLGDWIVEFLGGPGLHLAKLERQTIERAEEERRELRRALEELQ